MQEPLSRGRETAGRTPGMKEDHYRGLWEYKTLSSLPFWPLCVYIGYIWKSNIQFELLSDSIIKKSIKKKYASFQQEWKNHEYDYGDDDGRVLKACAGQITKSLGHFITHSLKLP